MTEDRRVEVENTTFFLSSRPTEMPEQGDLPDAYDIGFEFDDNEYRRVWVDGVPHAELPDGTLRPYIDEKIRADPEYARFIAAFDLGIQHGDQNMVWMAVRAMVLHMRSEAAKMRGEKALQAIREARGLLDEVDRQMDIQMEWMVVLSLAKSAQSAGESKKMRRQARGKGIEWFKSDSPGRAGG